MNDNKKEKSEGKWVNINTIIGYLFVIIISLFCIGLFVMYSYISEDVEKVSWSTDGMTVTILESRHPFGSWFNKNEITITKASFVINKHSFLGDEKINLPYIKVNKIIISDDAFGVSLKIISDDGFWGKSESIYLKKEFNKIWLTEHLKYKLPNIEVIEKTKLSKKISDFLMEK